MARKPDGKTAEAVRLKEAGLPEPEIAERVGVNERALRARLARQGDKVGASPTRMTGELANEAARLHREERLSDKEIARRLGVSGKLAKKMLSGRRVWTLTGRRAEAGEKADEAVRLAGEGLTAREIAERTGEREMTVRSRLRRRGLRLEKAHAKVDGDEAFRLHAEERLTDAEIARRFGVRQQSISKRLKNRRQWISQRPYDERDWNAVIAEKERGASDAEIAEKLGYSPQFVVRVLAREYPDRRIQRKDLDTDKIVETYLSERASVSELARRNGVERNTIYQRLDKRQARSDRKALETLERGDPETADFARARERVVERGLERYLKRETA